MSTRVRVLAFVLALAVVFLAARGVGAVTNPLGDTATATETHADMRYPGEDGDAHAPEGHDAEQVTRTPGGLQTSEQGYTLRVLGQDPLRFVVDDPEGHVVQVYDVVHEKPLHLVAVNRDGSGYQHLHPELSDDGVWSTAADLDPGTTRLVADFTPRGGPALILGTDVQQAGPFRPAPAPEPTRTVRVAGYDVELTGDLVPGEASPVTATITRDGVPVEDLEPYLGSYGHLVALREGDLAYLHVHPEDAGPGPEVPFVAEVPSTGRYRLYLDFQHDGTVRTAAFTLEATTDEH
jgi:hypothetical protein